MSINDALGQLTERIYADEARRWILRLLHHSMLGQGNHHILQALLDAAGIRLTQQRVRAHLHWLAESNLVVTEEVAGVTVVRLTEMGADQAKRQRWAAHRPSAPDEELRLARRGAALALAALEALLREREEPLDD